MAHPVEPAPLVRQVNLFDAEGEHEGVGLEPELHEERVAHVAIAAGVREEGTCPHSEKPPRRSHR